MDPPIDGEAMRPHLESASRPYRNFHEPTRTGYLIISYNHEPIVVILTATDPKAVSLA